MGRWLGRAISYGDTMCHWILAADTDQLIVRGTVRSADNTQRPNLALDSGEQPSVPVHQDNQESSHDLGKLGSKQQNSL